MAELLIEDFQIAWLGGAANDGGMLHGGTELACVSCDLVVYYDDSDGVTFEIMRFDCYNSSGGKVLVKTTDPMFSMLSSWITKANQQHIQERCEEDCGWIGGDDNAEHSTYHAYRGGVVG